MELKDIENKILNQLKNKPKFSFDPSKIYSNIIYFYHKNKRYDIEYKITYFNYRNSLKFSCSFIDDIRIIISRRRKAKLNHISEIFVYLSTIETDEKIIWKKINILSKRIIEQVSIEEHKNEVDKYSKLKIKNFLKRKFDLNIEFSDNKKVSINWYNYKQYGKNKIIREIKEYYLCLHIKKNNIKYYFNFLIYYPSKWNNYKLKEIYLDTQQKQFITPKKISNRIRYSKLKNLFNNERKIKK